LAAAFFKVPQKVLIWDTLVKVPLIKRLLRHFGGVPQKILPFKALLTKVPLITRFLGHFEEVPLKIATFWGTLIKVPLI
jgi:hypothetical protein